MNETPLPLTVRATSAFGASPPSRKPREDRPQRRVVVTVDRLDVPAEGAELRLEVAERDDLLRRLVGLHLVAVDDDPEPARAARARPTGAPPSSGPPAAPRLPVMTTTRPPRPSCRFASAIPRPLEMPIPSEPELASIPGTPTSGCPSSPPRRRSRRRRSRGTTPSAKSAAYSPGHVVALRREEDVAVGIVEPALGDVQLLEQEVRDDVERAERGAEVARAGALHGDERVQPARVGEQRQLRVGVDLGGAESIELRLRDEAQVGHGRHGTVADRARGPTRRADHELSPLSDFEADGGKGPPGPLELPVGRECSRSPRVCSAPVRTETAYCGAGRPLWILEAALIDDLWAG